MDFFSRPFGSDIGPLVSKRCRRLENKEAEQVEEFAFGPGPNPLGADIDLFSKPFGPDIGPLVIKRGRQLENKEAENMRRICIRSPA